jgi:hypothetical protein
MTMDAPGSLKLLQQLIAMGSGSLLQYVSQSFPYSADPDHAAFLQVQAIACEERDEAARLTRLMQKMHLNPPKTGSYPSHYTTMNFVTLDYLLPKLIAENEKEIAQIEAGLRQLADGETSKPAQSYVAMKRRHLEALQSLAAAKMPAATAG